MMVLGRLFCGVRKNCEGREVGGGVVCHQQMRALKVKEEVR